MINITMWCGKTLQMQGLVMAAAKWSAIVRTIGETGSQPECVEILEEDIDYAVGAIDHSFGRSQFLQLGIFPMVMRQLAEPHASMRLLKAMLGPQIDTQSAN